ncbi:MAG: hypothetical protein QXR19_02230 [Candidatus Jordarchaeaceae archaeon]
MFSVNHTEEVKCKFLYGSTLETRRIQEAKELAEKLRGARSPQGVVVHILLVMLAFLLAVLASVKCGVRFDVRYPSVLHFKS